MTSSRLLNALLLVALALPLALSSGCMTGKIPSAAFSGMTVKTVQNDPGSEKVELDVGLNFKVKNPLGIKLKVPGHTFGMKIDGSNVSESGNKSGFDVAPGTAKTVTYGFRIDLSEDGIGKAFGKDATIEFVADANVDVPKEIIDILGSIPGADQVVSDKAKEAGENLLSSGFEAIKGSAGEGSLGKAKLTFAHEGNIRLPKFPKISATAGGKPEVALIGESETANLDNVIGQLTSKVEPLAAFLDQFENAAMNQKVDIPVGELLERIGIPANLTGAALTAINGVLQLNGKSTIGSKNNSVEVPIDLPKLTSLLGTLDPKASQKINDFQSGWTEFKNNPSLGNLVIPTALPAGIRVATPFQIDNPNEFSIMAPSFKLGIVAADGSPIAVIGIASPTVMGGQLGATQAQLINVAGGGSSTMQLVSEFNWDKMGTNLLTAAATGATPDLSGMRLMGEISIDPGYGPITVPISIPLGAGVATSGSSSSKATSGTSSTQSKDASSTKSKSKDEGSTTTKSKDAGSTTTTDAPAAAPKTKTKTKTKSK